jgi:hypothetical protein
MLPTAIPAAPKASRFSDLKTILEDRRCELMRDLQDKIRAVRSDGHSHRDVIDDAEGSEVDIQDDIGFALMQLKTETLSQIDTALRRLEEAATATVSSAETKSQKPACERFRSPCAAGTANKGARRHTNVSAPWDSVVAPQISSSIRAARH